MGLVSCRRGRAHRGFTLIELLVVVAVVGVLIAVLLPALGKAMGSARSVKAASNMHQLALGHAHYANDFDGISIPGRAAKVGSGKEPANHYDVGNGKHYRPRWMVTMGAAAGFFAYDEPSTDPGKENDNNRRLDHEVFVDPVVPDWTNNRNYAIGYNFQFLGNARLDAGGDPVNFPVRVHELGPRTVLFASTLGAAASFAEGDRLAYNPTPHPDNDTRELADHGWSLDPPRLTPDADNCDGGRDGFTRSAPHERHQGKAKVAWTDGHVDGLTAGQLGYVQSGDGSFAYDEPEATNNAFSGSNRDDDPPGVQ